MQAMLPWRAVMPCCWSCEPGAAGSAAVSFVVVNAMPKPSSETMDAETVSVASTCDSVSDISSIPDVEAATVRAALKSFTRSAFRGRLVVLVRDLPADPFVHRLPAAMRLSADLEELTFVGHGVEIAIALSDIRDIYAFGVDGEEAFAKPLVEHLSPVESTHLLRLYHGTSEVRSISFVESTDASRDELLQCLYVLRKRSQRRKTRAKAKARSSASPKTSPRSRARRA